MLSFTVGEQCVPHTAVDLEVVKWKGGGRVVVKGSIRVTVREEWRV